MSLTINIGFISIQFTDRYDNKTFQLTHDIVLPVTTKNINKLLQLLHVFHYWVLLVSLKL